MPRPTSPLWGMTMTSYSYQLPVHHLQQCVEDDVWGREDGEEGKWVEEMPPCLPVHRNFFSGGAYQKG